MSIPDESTEPDNDTPAETLEEVMDREFEIFETQPDTDFDPNREEPDPTPTPTPDEDPVQIQNLILSLTPNLSQILSQILPLIPILTQ